MFRLVIDTNILIAAFLTPHGTSSKLLRQALEQHGVYLSPYILNEFLRVINYPRIRRRYQFTDEEVASFVTRLTESSNLSNPSTKISVCADPEDNAILALAVEMESDYLVTRNIKDFPGTYEGVKIVTPEQILKLL
jgi:putative PIN family toxin of toxin-antitoxin system